MVASGTMADDDEDGSPEFTFRPAVAARAANPELRQELEERIRERERRRAKGESDEDRDEAGA